MSHYFINDPSVKDEYKQFNIELNKQSFTFQTNSGVFSKNGLDFGTKLLLEAIEVKDEYTKILDMGCGYGPIGIFIAKENPKVKMVMADINQRALAQAKVNLKLNQVEAEIVESNLFSNISENFDMIITNPPIRTGKQNVFKLYEDAYENLNTNGQLWIVIQKKQGAPSTIEKMKELFGNCEIVTKKKGYYILSSTKATI